MIKINVITTHAGWRRHIKNPNNFIDKKIIFIIKKTRLLKKILFFALCYYLEIKK